MKKSTKLVACVLAVVLLAVTALFALPYIKKMIYPMFYEEYIRKYSSEFNVPQELVCAVIYTESRFDKEAESAVGAKGLMQLMPETHGWIAKRLKEETGESQIKNPEINIKYGTYYLSYLYERFEDWNTVVAAYNAGPNKVSQWLIDDNYSNDGKRLNKIPFAETDDYVNRVFSAEKQYKDLYFKGE